MKRITFLTTIILAFLMQVSFAQSVGINSNGTAPTSGAMLEVVQSGTSKTAHFESSNADGLGVHIRTTDNGNDKYALKVDTDNGEIEGLTVTNAGNVGIGTNTPSVPLHVYGTGTTGWVGRGAFGGENVAVVMGEYSGSAYLGAHNAALTGWADLIINEGGGKVCIGTTTPHGRLTIGGFGADVAAGIIMTPDNDIVGGHYMTFTDMGYSTQVGSIARGSGDNVLYNTSSDYRLKENVVNLDIDQAKSRLMSLRPVEYNYISDQNKTVISGFLAHEMADAGFANGVTGEKDAVDKDGKPIYQAIDTKFLIPEMVKVIQEQQTEIDALKKELDEIKKLIQYKK